MCRQGCFTCARNLYYEDTSYDMQIINRALEICKKLQLTHGLCTKGAVNPQEFSPPLFYILRTIMYTAL